MVFNNVITTSFLGRESLSKPFFLLLLLLNTSFLQAQELLKGNIEADSLMAGTVHIINVTQQTGTVNSASGSFEIRVNENDTLWLTSIQYEKAEIVITDSILQQKKLNVKLKEAVIILDDVNISNIALSGNISTDIGMMGLTRLSSPKLSPKEINRMKFFTEIPSSSVDPDNLAFEQNRITEGKEFFDLKIGLNFIENILKKKNTEFVDENSKTFYAFAKNIRGQFKDDFFKSTLGIEEQEIMDFLFDLNEEVKNSSVLKSSNSLALTELLISHSHSYKAKRSGG